MTEAEVQRLRDAGISDAVILEMQQEQEKKNLHKSLQLYSHKTGTAWVMNVLA